MSVLLFFDLSVGNGVINDLSFSNFNSAIHHRVQSDSTPESVEEEKNWLRIVSCDSHN